MAAGLLYTEMTVSKLASIAVMVLVLVAPVAAPLLAAMSCCPQPCEPMFRPASSCCKAGALPENATPGRLAVAPQLAEPLTARLAADTAIVPAELQAAAVFHPSHTVFLETPLRV